MVHCLRWKAVTTQSLSLTEIAHSVSRFQTGLLFTYWETTNQYVKHHVSITDHKSPVVWFLIILMYLKQALKSVSQTIGLLIKGSRFYWLNSYLLVVKHFYSSCDLMSSVPWSLCSSPMSPASYQSATFVHVHVFIDDWKLNESTNKNQLSTE